MQLFSFLSALPALLGLAGFVLYQVLGANKSGDEVSRRIIDKLRAAAPDEFTDQRLRPRQVERLLEHRQRLKELVGEQDFRLLKQALTQQFVMTILVYVLTLSFCAWSVYLFVQPPSKSVGLTTVQTSFGDQSPNVISNGSGSVTVQTGTPAPKPAGAKTKEKEK